MAARAYWSGRIRLALVSIPVDIVPATKTSSRISFNQIHEPSGKRIRYEKVVPGIGPVDTDDIVKGYEVDKGKYVLLSDEEIDEVKLEAKKLDRPRAVRRREARSSRSISSGRSTFSRTRTTRTPKRPMSCCAMRLRKTKKVGLGQVVVRGQGSIVAIRPFDKGLMMETLRYADEVKKPETVFDSASPKKKPDKDLIELAEELIEKKSGDFNPEKFKDTYHGRA